MTMKKKLMLLAAGLMLLAGTASASGINGDYKGNPIVKVTSNGAALEVDEVPAQILDGHTMVPIAMLRQIGASVVWNANTYGVDVRLNGAKVQDAPTVPTAANDVTTFIKGIHKEVKNSGITVRNIELGIDSAGTSSLKFEYIPGGAQSPEQINQTVAALLGISGEIPTEINEATVSIIVSSGVVGIITAKLKNCEDYKNKKLSLNDFMKKWSIK